MSWRRWVELFEGEDKRLSMTRFLCFASFPVSTYELVRLNSETALGYFVGAYVLGYVGGKLGDCINRPKA